MIEAYLDDCTPDGVIRGWARFETRAAACVVGLYHHGVRVAEAVADLFRDDLLAAGIGHGHFGFRARLARRLPQGRQAFGVVELSTGLPISNQREILLTIPAILAGGRPVTVEEMLREPDRWSTAQVIAHAATLGFDSLLKRLGPGAFVDRAYLFALGRTADPDGLAAYRQHLEEGSLRADEVIVALLASAERRQLGLGPPPSPHSPDYPFDAA